MNQNLESCLKKASRVVVKVGSNVLTVEEGLNLNLVRSLARQISTLMNRGVEVLLVSSGAMACGVRKIGLPGRPYEIPRDRPSPPWDRQD